MKAIATPHIIAEQYDSMGELINVLKHRDYSPYYKKAINARKVRKDFVYCDQMELKTAVGAVVDINDSLDMAMHGTDMFDDLIRKSAVTGFNIESDEKELDVKRPVNSMVGASPNVGRFIAGRPNAMRRRAKRDYSVKRNVSIIYTLDNPHFVSTETRLNCGLMIINALKALQSNGYSVEFSIGYACGNPQQGLTYLLEVPIKKYGNILDVRRIVFPIAGRASLFHIGRNWQQKMPLGIYLYRYGVSAWTDETQRVYMSRYFQKQNQVWLNTDIMTSIGADKKEGLGALVDYIINEKEIKTNPRNDNDDDNDSIIVNRYQFTDSNNDGSDYNDVWNGIELKDGDKPDSNRPLTEKTADVMITGFNNLTPADIHINSNAVATTNDGSKGGAVHSNKTVKISWWTLRLNSIKKWWSKLFSDVNNAF